MRSVWLRYLSLLGFVGLFGLVIDNPGFYGFFGFFAFFAFWGRVGDERLEANINRSARNAFALGVVVYAVAVVLAVVIPVDPALVLAFGLAVSFGLQMGTFGISLWYYEREGGGS